MKQNTTEVSEDFREFVKHIKTRAMANETPVEFAKRLEAQGMREVIVRKALRFNFDLSIDEATTICEQTPEARCKEVDWYLNTYPSSTKKKHVMRISSHFGISSNEAERWVDERLPIVKSHSA